jgi:hypothetical protein
MSDGYFVKGAWVKGIHPSLIGKKIIRTKPCCCGDYFDYSYCLNGKYFQQPDEWVILRGIENGCLLIEWRPRLFPGDMHTLEEFWNDGNWVEI